jgi:hypothetical protein
MRIEAQGSASLGSGSTIGLGRISPAEAEDCYVHKRMACT